MNYARRLARSAANRTRAASRKHRRTAIKDQIRRGFLAERLEDRMLMASDLAFPYHNYAHPNDVDGDSYVAASDVLAIINSINAQGSRILPMSMPMTQGESTQMMVDVDNDGYVAAGDVITVINFINSHPQGEAGQTVVPNKAEYRLHILSNTGVLQDTGGSQAATIRKDTDFYLQLVGTDIRAKGLFDTTVSPRQAFFRGVQSIFTDIVYDTKFADIVTNETQSIELFYDVSDASNPPPTFKLTLPGHTQTTSITIATKTDASGALVVDGAVTAKSIQDALDVALFGGLKTTAGTKVSYNGKLFNVTFTGFDNQDLPTMSAVDSTGDSSNIAINEVFSGSPTIQVADPNNPGQFLTVPNTLAAIQYEPDQSGADRYPTDHSGTFIANYGLDDVGGFTQAASLGTNALAALRIHMKSKLAATGPDSVSKVVTFAPDPLGDGSGSIQDMERPRHNSNVYGNTNIKNPVDAIAHNGDVFFRNTVISTPLAPTHYQFSASPNQKTNDTTPVDSGTTLSNVDNFYVGYQVRFLTGAAATSQFSQPVIGYIGATHTFIFSTDPQNGGFRDKNGTALTINANDTFTIETVGTKEEEVSLILSPLTNNEFILVPVVLTINSGIYAPVNGETASVSENTIVGGVLTTNSSTPVNVVSNDTLSGGPANPVKEIKSLSTTTTGVTSIDIFDPADATKKIGTATIVAVGGVNTSIKFTPVKDYNSGTGTVSIPYVGGVVGDNDPLDTGVGTLSVTVTPVNSVPTLTVPGAQPATGENIDVSLSGFSVADTDITEGSGSHLLSMTVTATNNAVLSITAAGVTGNNSSSLTFSGTPADVTTALNTLKVSNPTQKGLSTVVTVKADDGGQFGATTSDPEPSKTISVTFPDLNDAPTVAAPATATVKFGVGDTRVFSNEIIVSDVDIASATQMTTQLTATGGIGTLTLGSTAGITITAGANNSSAVTIKGTLAAINGALNGLILTPPPSANSVISGSIDILAKDDLNATGTASIAFTVVSPSLPFAVPDPFIGNNAVLEGQATYDLDVLANDLVNDKVNQTPVLVANSLSTPAFGSVEIVGNKIRYHVPDVVGQAGTPDLDFFTRTNLTFTYTMDEDPHNGQTQGTSVGTVTLQIKNVADAPVAGQDGPYKATFDSSLTTQDTLVIAAPGVLSNDTDADNNATYDGATPTAHLSAVVTQPPPAADGTLSLLATGGFSYTPKTGNDVDFKYKAHSDVAGAQDSNEITVHIHVTNPPSLTSGSVSVPEGQTSPITVDSFYSDGETPPSALASVVIDTPLAASKGTVTIGNDGKSFVYAPPAANADFEDSRQTSNGPVAIVYHAVAADGRPSHKATLTITVTDVNDNPTAHDFGVSLVKRGSGDIGKDQPVIIPATVVIGGQTVPTISTAPDFGESLKVTSLTGKNNAVVTADPTTGDSAEVDTDQGGTIKLVNFQIKYTAPAAETTDSFKYTVSDFDNLNGGVARTGSATGTVTVNVVQFIPKTVSGRVYVDSDNDGQFDYVDANSNTQFDSGEISEKTLGGIIIQLSGTDVLHEQFTIIARTKSDGTYTFPDFSPGLVQPTQAATDYMTGLAGLGGLKPPDASGYTLTEIQPGFLVNGRDTNPSTTNFDNGDPNNLKQIVTNTSPSDDSMLLIWSLLDSSNKVGNVSQVVDLNFGEGNFNTSATGGGLSDTSGFKGEMLSSTGKNGFIAAVDLTGKVYWSWTIEGDAGAWAGYSLASAKLTNNLNNLVVTLDDGESKTLGLGYLSSTDTARFRILGSGLDSASGQKLYIVRIDASYDGTYPNGMSDGMFITANVNAAATQGEAPVEQNFANSADAVFEQQAWA